MELEAVPGASVLVRDVEETDAGDLDEDLLTTALQGPGDLASAGDSSSTPEPVVQAGLGISEADSKRAGRDRLRK